MSKGDVNQKSIAESLNISVATVSKALSDSDEINRKTRAKVVNMATKLGYNYLSRSRKRAIDGQNHFVGVLIHSDTDDIQHTRYFAGMSEKCAKLNVSLMLHYFNSTDCEKVLEPEHQPPVMRDGQLSGLILVNRWPLEVIRELSEQMPLVSVIHEVPEVGIDTVGIDDTRGMGMLMDHLYRLGHRKIGVFGRCAQMRWS